ncbi:MAG: ATP-binding protein [Pirellulales bacterium]
MDRAFLERLLHEDESATLDFKAAQYPFAKATDDEKSELLKDILGFVNAFRRGTAYILIGVEDVRGGRSNVVGVTHHLDDHSLQQFVNSLTNRPVHFRYEATEIESVKVGVIHIEEQGRPVYLKKDYGPLRRNEVYVRRGSSTNPSMPALPDEIASMGAAQNSVSSDPSLVVELVDVDNDETLGNATQMEFESCHVPDPCDIPDYRDADGNCSAGSAFPITFKSPFDKPNRDFFRERAVFERTTRLFHGIRLAVSNRGDVGAKQVRVEASVSRHERFVVANWTQMPDKPHKLKQAFSLPKSRGLVDVINPVGVVDFRAESQRTRLAIEFGNLQPGRRECSEMFYIATDVSGEHELCGYVFAANLSAPVKFNLTVHASVVQTSLTVEELTSLPDLTYDE